MWLSAFSQTHTARVLPVFQGEVSPWKQALDSEGTSCYSRNKHFNCTWPHKGQVFRKITDGPTPRWTQICSVLSHGNKALLPPPNRKNNKRPHQNRSLPNKHQGKLDCGGLQARMDTHTHTHSYTHRMSLEWVLRHWLPFSFLWEELRTGENWETDGGGRHFFNLSLLHILN